MRVQKGYAKNNRFGHSDIFQFCRHIESHQCCQKMSTAELVPLLSPFTHNCHNVVSSFSGRLFIQHFAFRVVAATQGLLSSIGYLLQASYCHCLFLKLCWRYCIIYMSLRSSGNFHISLDSEPFFQENSSQKPHFIHSQHLLKDSTNIPLYLKPLSRILILEHDMQHDGSTGEIL